MIDTSKIDRMELRRAIAAERDAVKRIDAESAAIAKPFTDEIARIEEARDAAIAAHDAQQPASRMDPWPGEILNTDDDGLPVVCAVSGLVLLTGDEILIDEDDTSVMVLRAAIGLPLSAGEPDGEGAVGEDDGAVAGGQPKRQEGRAA